MQWGSTAFSRSEEAGLPRRRSFSFSMTSQDQYPIYISCSLNICTKKPTLERKHCCKYRTTPELKCQHSFAHHCACARPASRIPAPLFHPLPGQLCRRILSSSLPIGIFPGFLRGVPTPTLPVFCGALGGLTLCISKRARQWQPRR